MTSLAVVISTSGPGRSLSWRTSLSETALTARSVRESALPEEVLETDARRAVFLRRSDRHTAVRPAWRAGGSRFVGVESGFLRQGYRWREAETGRPRAGEPKVGLDQGRTRDRGCRRSAATTAANTACGSL